MKNINLNAAAINYASERRVQVSKFDTTKNFWKLNVKKFKFKSNFTM